MPMLRSLRAFVTNRLLLREVRGLRQEVAGLRQETAHLAQVVEAVLLRLFPPPLEQSQSGGTEVTFVSEAEQAEIMDIELRLTAAHGLPPTEDEVLAELERRHEGRQGEFS